MSGPPTLPATPARRLRDALEPIGTQAFYALGVREPLAARGLSFLETYVWGRAAALGTPAASVVVAAFGVFEPRFLAGAYERARSLVPREEVLALRAQGASAALAAVVGADAAPLADALLAAVEQLDGTARPLFSGLRELPVPADPPGRLWRAAELVREHRGDGHLAACVAAGLDAVSMNVLTELWLGYAPGEYTATRAWSEEAIAASLEALTGRGWVEDGRLTEAGAAARRALEDATDAAQEALVERLGDRVDGLVEALAAVSSRLVDSGAYPGDARKRAAG